MGEKGERPERVFPGRTDPWFIAAMVIVAGGLSAACIACFLSSSPTLLWGWLALLPVPALVALAALPVRSNRLELYGDRLVVVYAGMRSVIPYAHVRGVRRTRTLWAGTANSLDRVYIEAPYDGDAIVSVTDNDALVAELERRCGLRPGLRTRQLASQGGYQRLAAHRHITTVNSGSGWRSTSRAEGMASPASSSARSRPMRRFCDSLQANGKSSRSSATRPLKQASPRRTPSGALARQRKPLNGPR